MSTRSGKRIHGSLHENTVKTEIELAPKSERKTRSKLMKENIGDQNIVLNKLRKRENYVSYPTDDEQVGDTGNLDDNEGKHTRTVRKNALKEHNPTIKPSEISDCEVPPKNSRSTRRTRKFTESASEPAVHVDIPNAEGEVGDKKTKKNKRKKNSSEGHGETQDKPKKKNKKKKGRRSNSFVTENVEEMIVDDKIVNKSIVSNDSFHSAAGSPVRNKDADDKALTALEVPALSIIVKNEPKMSIRRAKKTDSINKSIEKINSLFETNNASFNKNETERESQRRKSSIKNAGIQVTNEVMNNRKSGGHISLTQDTDGNISQNKNNTFDIEPQRQSTKIESPVKTIDTAFEEDLGIDLNYSKSRKRKSTIDTVDSNTDMITSLNGSKQTNTRSSLLNSTYDKLDTSAKVNTTFELDKNNLTSSNKTKESITMNTTFEKTIESPKTKKRRSGIVHSDRPSMELSKNNTGSLNTTFEKNKTDRLNNSLNRGDTLNATFEKEQNLNTTFDKLSKSSLISSDSNTEDISRISITSDESITEPKIEPKKPVTIMNETPVFLDSTLEDSMISESMKPDEVTVPTPLRREGTFTKNGPDNPNMSENDRSPVVTPRKVSLPSPGCTPFPNKSSSKEKPLLNVTRSVEKSRKSGVEPAPRITRVMFCSPVNNPVVVAHQKGTVIKSNLKGSNKSFIYEDTVRVGMSPGRAAPRKRSHTHCSAEPAGAKRSRLADDLRQSAERLARPRTSSASAKLTDQSTPSKKSTTPSKAKVPRTKLPNFAALHQKQFDKMESLDECQERRAKRARHLLTPTPTTTAPTLSDNAHKVIAEIQKEPPKKDVVKKVDMPFKSFSQEASKPAYTRFGFKLNLDVNPFSIPIKTAVKPKENVQRLARQVTLPSLAGATSMRREVAKQVVMREKSFTDKRQIKRNENRTIIKGVRTNRRFELQMKLRNIE